jgi:hypothetical protein
MTITYGITKEWWGPLPADAAERKKLPITTGVLDYFPDAIAAVAAVSRLGNEQHNPGQPLHWAREKSTDHADCIARHLLERGTLDADGARHSAKLAWRALALLQLEIEAGWAAMNEESQTPGAKLGPLEICGIPRNCPSCGGWTVLVRSDETTAMKILYRYVCAQKRTTACLS